MTRTIAAIALAAVLLSGTAGCRGTPDEPPPGLPVAGYAAVEDPPLIYVGEGSEADVAAAIDGTLRPSVAALRSDLYTAGPAPGLQVWLFPDADARERHGPAVATHHDPGHSGYYSVADHVVVATVADGASTPLHYLSHAFLRADIPGCPVWYDEGLGALLERSELVDGHVVGLAPAPAIVSRPALADLLAMDGPTFHGPGREDHAAAARSLCLHLQQHDLLRSFHRQLRADLATDPDGSRTLLAVSGAADLAAFEVFWRHGGPSQDPEE